MQSYNKHLQFIHQWKSDISNIQNQLMNKYGKQDLKFNINKSFELYSSAFIPSHEIQLLQSEIQVRYPQIPIQNVIQKLYNYHQEQLELKKVTIFYKKHTNLIAQYLRQSLQGKDPSNLIDCVHQYLSVQGYLPDIQNRINQARTCIPSSLTLKSKNNECQNEDDFYDEKDIENPLYFQGKIIEKGNQQLKQNLQNFTGQKKVVHVFTKKGYGVQTYRKYLQQRKMDKKEWQYYEKEFVQQDKYDFYLSSAIHASLNIVIEFVRNLRDEKFFKDPFSHLIDETEFDQIINSIYQMKEPQKMYLKNCLRVVYELKIEQKISKKHVVELYRDLSEIRSYNHELMRKRMEVDLINEVDQTIQLNEFDDDDNDF